MTEQERQAALMRYETMIRRMEGVKRFTSVFDCPDTPRGSLLQTDGSITAEMPFWELTGETREEWMERVRLCLAQEDQTVVLLDTAMVEESDHRYFRASFALKAESHPSDLSC